MELNGFNSDKYIYLKIMDDIRDKDGDIIYKRGQIARFLRSDLEQNVFSRLISQGISEGLEYVRKDEVKDNEIFPHQVNSKIYFKEDTVAHLILWPKERYCFNEWMFKHLSNHELDIHIFSASNYRDEENFENIRKNVSQGIQVIDGVPFIDIDGGNLDLTFTFKKGEELDFTDPGVMSLLLDPFYINLLLNSHVIMGKAKDKLFTREFKNAFKAKSNTYYSFHRDDSSYHYYKVNDDVCIKDNYKMPGVHSEIYTRREDGMADIVYLEVDYFQSFERYDELYMKEIGKEIPREEAMRIHEERLEHDRIKREKEMDKWKQKQLEHEEKIEKLFAEHRNDDIMFPGINGNFTSTSPRDERETYSIEEIKNFFKELSKVDKDALDAMYFYGGSIPYVMNDENDTRDFGDVDIFVPIEKMALVRQALDSVGLLRSYDSISLTSEHNFTSRIKEIEDDEENNFSLLGAMLANDEEAVNSYNMRGRVYQDFGLKGSLFGINISIFPLYQYKEDLMAKSFKVSDLHNYLLAVRVINNMKLGEVAKNINIYGNNLNIMPFEYTIVSKEGAIKNGYIKRTDKDYHDLEYINSHREELGIDENMLEVLRNNYPDYSVALAYFVYDNCIEKVSGERYKELILEHGGEYVS